MTQVFFKKGDRYFPVMFPDCKIADKPEDVHLAPYVESPGRFYLKGKHSLRDGRERQENYDGNTGLTDRFAAMQALELGNLFDAEQVIVEPSLGFGTQSYEFEYKFEIRAK